MKTLNIKSYSELKKLYSKFNEHYVFRGQADSNWEINSSLYRNKFIRDKAIGEEKIIEDFEKSIHLYNSRQKLPESKLERLAFLQHYGAPTRLIDFTYSPYIATYFAVRDSAAFCSIYAIDYIWLLRASVDYLQGIKINFEWQVEKLSKGRMSFRDAEAIFSVIYNDLDDQHYDMLATTEQYGLEYNALDKIRAVIWECNLISGLEKRIMAKSHREVDHSFLFTNSGKADLLVKVEPFYQNERRNSQSGCFLCQTNVSQSFKETIESLKEINGSSFFKINVPIKLRDEIMTDLSKMNISEETLFPDLGGFVRSLGVKAEN